MKVAAITPTFERYSSSIIRAFTTQTYPNKRIYLVDNNEDKGFLGRTVRPPACWADGLFVLTPHGNIGASAARNLGIEQAIHDGIDAVCFWDDDDAPYPQYLSRMSRALIDSGKPIAACRVAFEGHVLEPSHFGTQGRMILTSAIGNRRWPSQWPGQDKAWWRQFANLEYEPVGEVLIEARRGLVGGFRSPRAVKV
jgi:GT2 family glycosyltransferase